jgi:hypothetical protein
VPTRKFHNQLTKLILGKSGKRVQKWMDMPSYGNRHRFLFHNPHSPDFLIPILLATIENGDLGGNLSAAILHSLTDQAVSTLKKDNPIMELLLKQLGVI